MSEPMMVAASAIPHIETDWLRVLVQQCAIELALRSGDDPFHELVRCGSTLPPQRWRRSELVRRYLQARNGIGIEVLTREAADEGGGRPSIQAHEWPKQPLLGEA